MKQVKVGVLGLFEGSPSRVLLGFERSFVTVLHKHRVLKFEVVGLVLPRLGDYMFRVQVESRSRI